MEFRRIHELPPYGITIVTDLMRAERRAGRDVIDMGFGNPDIPSPAIAVDKLAEAARKPANHRYSVSRGIPRLRQEVAARYGRMFDVDLDPETEVIATLGAKEGFMHLMWVLLAPGDVAMVPSPSYPIHLYGPIIAGAQAHQIQLGGEHDFFANLEDAFERSWPKPRVIVLSFPHNPTTTCVDLAWMQRIVDFAREHQVLLVHDFAYSDTAFDGYRPPSVLQAEGGKQVAVELYSLTKSFSMAGWRIGFLVGNSEVVAALAKFKSYLDYGAFQPIQIAAAMAMAEASDYPIEVNDIYRSRRDTLVDGLAEIGWQVERPRGTMFVWAPIPPAYAGLGSIEFAKLLVREAGVATAPGVGFGADGEGFIRFALIENEQRIRQAIRSLRRALRDSAVPDAVSVPSVATRV